MDLREYVRLLRRRWRLIVLCTLVGVTVGIVVTATSTKTYTARSQFFVSAQDRSAADISSAYTGGLFTQQRVKSYVSVLQSTRTGALVKADLKSPLSAQSIAGRISASAPLDTVLINLAVVDSNPAQATLIANSVGRVFPQLVDDIERPSSGGPSPVRVSVVQAAAMPTAPTSPRPKINLGLGMLVGLALGIAGAVLRETLDTSISSTEQTRELVGAPILGAINFDPEGSKRPLVVVESPSSARAESFRQLRTNLQFVDIEHPLRSVVFTSSVPGEGKSTTTCNLAITLTQAGLRVVLVEGDLRRPRIADYMGLEGAVGLTSVLLGRTTLDDALQTWGDGSLQVLASGPLPPNPSELLGSQGMQDLLRELERRVDIVIIDAPPLLPVTDAAVLGTLTSGLVMLVRSNHTRREQVTGAVATVHAVGGLLLGAVLNMVPTRGPNSYSYGYGYSYSYKPSPTATRLLDSESPVGAPRQSDNLRESGRPEAPPAELPRRDEPKPPVREPAVPAGSAPTGSAPPASSPSQQPPASPTPATVPPREVHTTPAPAPTTTPPPTPTATPTPTPTATPSPTPAPTPTPTPTPAPTPAPTPSLYQPSTPQSQPMPPSGPPREAPAPAVPLIRLPAENASPWSGHQPYSQNAGEDDES